MEGRKIFKRSIPNEILSQIFCELPVKSLSRFKCVSKEWCSLIEDPEFVDSHRLRSHTRSGGIRLLGLQAKSGPSALFLLDPEGNSQLMRMPLPPGFCCNLMDKMSPNAEGLLCFGNFIWNPSTKESLRLPDQDWGSIINYPAGSGNYKIENRYILGFDASSKRYKVLSILTLSFTDRQFVALNKRDSQGRAVIQVLTLGTNSWRTLDCIPEVIVDCLLEVFRPFMKTFASQFVDKKFYASLAVDNKIFLLISPCTGNTYFNREYHNGALLTFEVGQEKFRIVGLPDGLNYTDFVLEVSGKFAMIDRKNVRTIWILQDYENEKWIKRNIKFPSYFEVANQGINNSPSAVSVTPIGTIHTREILFEARKPSPSRKRVAFYFYYNLATTNVRQVPKDRLMIENGDNIMFGNRDNIVFFKHVENIFRLKQDNM